MKKFLSIVALTVLLVMTVSVCAVMAEDVQCEACYEVITEQDVAYDDDGEAICVYCEEVLSAKVLDALFYEETEEETLLKCQNCGKEMAEDEAFLTEINTLVCALCKDAEEEQVSGEDEENEETGILLNASDWAKSEVNEAFGANLIPLELISVDLKTEVNRKEFAAIAVALYERITGKIVDDSIENIPFKDCSESDIFTRYVAAAYKLGVTNGTSETTFAPEQTITREQLATMLYRVILKAESDGIIVNNIPVTLEEFLFDDDNEIADYARGSVYYMFERGIIKGMSDVEFAPRGVATKEQAILISNRINKVLY